MTGPESSGNMGGGEGFPLPLVADLPMLNTLNLSECLNIYLWYSCRELHGLSGRRRGVKV